MMSPMSKSQDTEKASEMLRRVADQLESERFMASYWFWLAQSFLVNIERKEFDKFGITESELQNLDFMGMEMFIDKTKILRESQHRSGIETALELARKRVLVLDAVQMVARDMHLHAKHSLDLRNERLKVTGNSVVFERGQEDMGSGYYVRQAFDVGDKCVGMKFETGRKKMDLKVGWRDKASWLGTYAVTSGPNTESPGYSSITDVGPEHDRFWGSIAQGYYMVVGAAYGWPENQWAAQLTNSSHGRNPVGVRVPWANPVS